MDVAGRDRLHAEMLGQAAQQAETPRVSALVRALQLDVEPLAAERAGKARRSVRVEQTEPAPRAAREADEPCVRLHERVERDRGRQRFAVLVADAARSRVCGREQAAEIPVAVARLDEQRDVGAAVERDLRPGDRPHTERLGRVRELERAVDAVVVGERECLVAELRRPRRELLGLRGAVEKRVRRVRVELDVRHGLGCWDVVEIGAGEIILRSPKLDVTLLVDIEQLVAVEVRAAPGWGRTPPHVHARHGEALYVLEGELELQLENGVERVGPETWAFVPPGVVHVVEITGDTPARYLALHAPGAGYGDYVRGDVAAFDQRPAADYVSADPGLAVVRRAGGSEGDRITDRPERRATVLVETDEITISEFHYGPGERGAPRHVHRQHADAFLVLEGAFTFHLRDGSRTLPAGTLVVFPPGVVHGFDNDSDAFTRAFNFHMPSFGFADYMRGRNSAFDQLDPPEDGGVDPSAVVVARVAE